MKLTVAEITKGLTQVEYERLLSNLAGAIHTQRRFIEIEDVIRRTDGSRTCYRVKRKGVYYLYLIEERSDLKGKRTFLNLGFVI